MAKGIKCVAFVVMASFSFVFAMAAGDGQAERPMAESELSDPSRLIRVRDSYQDYYNDGRYGLEKEESADDPSGVVISRPTATKRASPWPELYGNVEGQTTAFWKRYAPSERSAFWKRRIGSGADGRQRAFWKRNSFRRTVDGGDAFWKRSVPVAVLEGGRATEKRSFVPLPVIFHPKYRNVLPVNDGLTPIRKDDNASWLIRTLTRQGRMPHVQQPDLPLPPKDRRQEPKLNPDFNPTGW